MFSYPFSNKVRPLVTYWEITRILKGAPAQPADGEALAPHLPALKPSRT